MSRYKSCAGSPTARAPISHGLCVNPSLVVLF